jgi:hypothetical protein
MALVSEVGGNGGGKTGAGPDIGLASVNRVLAAVHGTETPEYIGEIVTDIAADQNYVGKRADGDLNADALGNTDWAKTSRG